MNKITNYNNPSRYNNPFSLIDEIERELARPFFWGDVSRTGDNVRFKEGDELIVEIDLPGVPKNKTTISVEGRVVMIEGSRKVVHKGGVQEETFNRSFKVHESYNLESVKAEQVDGVLKIVFPKNTKENGGKKIISIS
jgi:HSP20 family protein